MPRQHTPSLRATPLDRGDPIRAKGEIPSGEGCPQGGVWCQRSPTYEISGLAAIQHPECSLAVVQSIANYQGRAQKVDCKHLLYGRGRVVSPASHVPLNGENEIFPCNANVVSICSPRVTGRFDDRLPPRSPTIPLWFRIPAAWLHGVTSTFWRSPWGRALGPAALLRRKPPRGVRAFASGIRAPLIGLIHPPLP